MTLAASSSMSIAERRWIWLAVTTWAVAALVAPGALAGQELPTWSISPEAVEMGAGADELFQSVRFGLILPDGGAVVADVGGLLLRLYGPDGTRRAELGGPGDGPGEFRSIFGLWLTAEGRIGVWDARSGRFTIFEPDGRLAGTHPVRAEGEVAAGNLEVLLGSFRDGDVLLAALRIERRRSPTGATPERWVLGRFGPDGQFRGSPGEVRGMWRARRGPLPFSPVPRVAVRRDSIWVAEGYEPELEVWSADGEAVRRIELPWTVSTSDDHRSALEAELRRRDRRFFLELLEETPRTDELPPVGGLLADDRLDHLWLKVYDPLTDALWLKRNALEVGPGGEWRVLDLDGRWLATVRMPDHQIPLDIRGDRLLAVARDALDVERVVVHTVVR